MTLPARAPYCLKCQSFTTLDDKGCEECGSRDVEIRDLPKPATMEPPLEITPKPAPVPITIEHGAVLFQKLRESL